MKNIYTTILIIILATTTAFAQSTVQCHQLSELSRTWGLLKYYHPEIASGKYDWDSVVIANISNLLSSKYTNGFHSAIDNLLTVAGIDTASYYSPETDHSIRYSNYDISWIKRARYLSNAQKEKLYYIATHPHRGKNFYALPGDAMDSTVATVNEKPYKDMLLPDVKYRLLGLFRFWNVINYYYPYKYAIGKPWDKVQQEMIPVMINSNDTLSYYRAIVRMAASINDSHGGLWPEVFKHIAGKYMPPFNFRLIEGKAVVTKIIDSTLAHDARLQVGATLTSINGVPISRLIKTFWEDVPASNAGGKLKSMHAFILNTHSAQAQYGSISKDGKKFNMVLPQIERDFLKDYLDFFQMNSKITAKILEGNIGYVFFSNLHYKNLDSVMKSLWNTKAIIFDMRNYPMEGTGTYQVPGYLLSQPELYARNTYPDFSLPGRFNYMISNEGTAYSQVGRHNPNPYKGKIILLVDSRTQSAAEWACMTLLTSKNVTIIGNQTAGADGNVTRTILPGGYKIAFSGLGIYFPDGTETQRKGIPIDIEVQYTVADLIENRDPLLAKAIEFVNK
ncbi:C-terminal processing protease CtpA/Prc [Chitinophaga dinghuensis]|uniref:C-terminal processing protease CtpA/Prc n=1 Tax=Chitinophaga dinghuensis TaxID=1539050 RepID=A0A327WAS3_9BACT|nr:S41 family peptidase [Chitinophaga dinghuensis]RAJ83158.1 C-terminal processing protease CtpA/Prc [Chitinophaga dinghuensis]